MTTRGCTLTKHANNKSSNSPSNRQGGCTVWWCLVRTFGKECKESLTKQGLGVVVATDAKSTPRRIATKAFLCNLGTNYATRFILRHPRHTETRSTTTSQNGSAVAQDWCAEWVCVQNGFDCCVNFNCVYIIYSLTQCIHIRVYIL